MKAEESSMTDQQIVSSDHRSCPNCGSELLGNYCSNCGQHDQDMRRPFFKLLGEVLSSLLELDGRAYRTIYYLFTKPGFLSSEYVSGRRMSYTPPLRLFLVISISFFLIISAVNSVRSMQSILLESQTGESTTSEASTEPDLNFQLITGIDEEDIFTNDNIIEADDEDLKNILSSIDNFSLGFLSERANENLRTVIKSQTRANFNEIVDDPAEFLYGTLEYITFFILMMIPVLALIQKVFYIRSGRLYIEHLILALHNHAFIILAFFLLMLFDTVAKWDLLFMSAGFDYLGLAVMIWIVVYLFLSLKNFFQQGKFVTLLKFSLASMLYIFCLSTGILFFGLLWFFVL